MKTYTQFKTGSARSDWFATQGFAAAGSMPMGEGAINPIGQAAAAGSGIGSLMGMGSGPATEAEELEWDRTPEKAMIPGIAGIRMQRRLKRQLTDDAGDNPHYWSQSFGHIAPALLMVGAGTAYGLKHPPKSFLGEPLNTKDTGANKMVGGLLGFYGGLGAFGLTTLAAALLAAATRTRTKEEQKEYANSSTLAEWLIPGVSTYNKWKTLGRSFKDSDERIAKDQAKKKKEAETAEA